MLYFLIISLILMDYCNGTFFGGGGGGGCGCGGGCPPAPICPPISQCPQISCSTGGGGIYSGGYSSGQPIAAGGYYAPAPAPAAAIPFSAPVQVSQSIPYSPNSYVSAGSYPGSAAYIGNANSGVAGPVSGVAGSYITPNSQASLKTSSIKTRYSSSDEKDKDLYDDPPPDFKVADVSAESKELHPSDIFKRRYLMLKNLRHRHLRQLSAPSLPIPSSNVCNNEKLARIMAKSIVTDISISKRLVRKATEIAFDGLKFDVICAQGDFSYSIYAEQYCETTRGNVTCFAFT